MLNFSPLELLLACHAFLLPLSLCTGLEHPFPSHSLFPETYDLERPTTVLPEDSLHTSGLAFITLYPNCRFVCLRLLAVRSLKMGTMSDSSVCLEQGLAQRKCPVNTSGMNDELRWPRVLTSACCTNIVTV